MRLGFWENPTKIGFAPIALPFAGFVSIFFRNSQDPCGEKAKDPPRWRR
jgi:hypothetical protein